MIGRLGEGSEVYPILYTFRHQPGTLQFV